MIDRNLLVASPFAAAGHIVAGTATAFGLASLLLGGAFATKAHADQGDCAQPSSTGPDPLASDCLFILRVAVGIQTCAVECVCAPKGTLPTTASDALLCLRSAVGQPVNLNCPCDEPTTTTTNAPTTTIASGVVGAIALQGRMSSHLELGLEAATLACDDAFAGSDYCLISEILADEGEKLAGLEDIEGDPVTSFWAIDPNVSVARQCGQSLNESGPRWTYATAHLGVGGDFVPLDNATGELGTMVIGGGSNRNCSSTKWVACCR